MNGAYLHLLINHLPVLGNIFGILLLLYAFLRKSEEIKRVSLGVFVLTALSAVPAFLTGEPAEEVVEHLPGVSKALIEQHEGAALIALIFSIATGLVGLAGLFLARRAAKLPAWAAAAALVLALASGGLIARTAGFGGEIRHTEIRAGATAQPAMEATPKEEKKEGHE